jgi:hypothetical protein
MIGFIQSFIIIFGFIFGLITTSIAPISAFAQEVVRPDQGVRWHILKTQWDAEDELAFSRFVAAIGESGCRTADQCFKSEANPYRATDPRGSRFRADCADFPMQLRAYFAAKKGLPFSFAVRVDRADSADRGRNIRYTAHGNRVVERMDIVVSNPRSAPLITRILSLIGGRVSSAVYRINPLRPEPAGLFMDTYPVRVDRTTVRPGTVLYDPNGHVAIIYRVGEDGRVFFMDAHPDNSITRGTFSARFARGRPTMAGGIKNWRGQRLEGATLDPATQTYLGGRIVATQALDALPDFSLEQYTGTEHADANRWREAQFLLNGEALSYHDFVRSRLVSGEFRLNPVTEIRNLAQDLCTDLQDRVAAVDAAVAAGLPRTRHPDRLPDNIYGTNEMTWETYSTPSRDARLRTAMAEARARVEQLFEMRRTGDARLVYAGNERAMARDMLRAFYTVAEACPVVYRRSNGVNQTIRFVDALDRAYGFSFDPYHCVERRWGATAAEELSSCTDNAINTAWYEAEQVLRNQLERTYDQPMGWSLAELQRLNPAVAGVGVMTIDRPSLDIEEALLVRTQ